MAHTTTSEIDVASTTEKGKRTDGFDPVYPASLQISNKGMRLGLLKQFLMTSLPMMLGDVVAIEVALAFAAAVSGFLQISAEVGQLAILLSIGTPLVMAAYGLYPGVGLCAVVELRKSVLGMTLMFTILIATASAFRAPLNTIVMLILSYSAAIVLIPLARSTIRLCVSRLSFWGYRVLVFGGDETAIRAYRYFLQQPRLGLKPVQIVDEELTGIDSTEQINLELVRSLQVEHGAFFAVITVASETDPSVTRGFAAMFPRVLFVRNESPMPSGLDHPLDAGVMSGTLITNHLLLPVPRFAKALLDFVLTTILSILCLPLLVLIAVTIKATSKGPILYAQNRIGKRGRSFWVWKFRTMRVDADTVLGEFLDSNPKLRKEWELNHKLKNDPRVTLIGSFLRKTSLDELPQLWNVLRGEMSLVGPRPIVRSEIAKYGAAFELYARTTPGITGLWQVSGRNNTTYDERVNYDAQYVMNWSPWLDLYILLRTIKVVILREGAC